MKNPFMSAWLSAANKMTNTVTGAARGQAMAETRKAQAKMLAEMQKGWMQAMGLVKKKGKARKSR